MLTLKEISKSFPGCFAPAIHPIHLTLNTGDFCVLIGSNGSGKSTLMRMIAGEMQPDAGQIFFDHQDVTHLDRHPWVASVVQDVRQGTIPEMTLLENMVLSLTRIKPPTLRLYQRYRDEVMAQVSALGMGLEKYLDTPLGCLSGGQRQMIATLMAVQARPYVLLLDEHTSALDPHTQASLMQYTHQAICDQNMTSLMITHRLDDAIQYGNRLIMLHQGKIVFDVSGAEKAQLDTATLLARFHQYEDLSLITHEGRT